MTEQTKQILLTEFQEITRYDDEVREKYSHDESIFKVVPEMVMEPRSREELAHVVKRIHELRQEDDSLSLTTRAAGTGLSGGSLNTSIIINVLPHFANLIEISTNETNPHITVESGMLYKDFEKHLDGTDYTMPIFPSSRQWCAIGGMIGNNAAGENTLKYGAQDGFVTKLQVILNDGNEYTIEPVNFDQFTKIVEKNNRLSQIYTEIFTLIESHWQMLDHKPTKASKNVSGYALWKSLETDPERFKQGDGTLDLTKIFVGSQGTLGVIVEITYALMKKPIMSDLMIVPVNNLDTLSETVSQILAENPEKIELFDRRTFELAKKYPEDFKRSFFCSDEEYEKFVYMFEHHVMKHLGEHDFHMVLLTQLSGHSKTESDKKVRELTEKIEDALIIEDEFEARIYWSIRYSSLALIASHSEGNKPAAFLEDLVIPVENFGPFYHDLYTLIEQEELHCAVHGHAGNVHLHFYPLIDFTKDETPGRIVDLCDTFFVLAKKYKGSISGEHNDGIIRTPYMSLMYSDEWITLFEKIKDTFDPNNIFNPGKKVYPRFDIAQHIRRDNNAGYFQTQ